MNQSVGEGIVHAQIWGCSIVLIRSDHLGPLVVPLRTIAQKTVRARTVLPEVDAVAAAEYGLRRNLIGKAKTRLNIFPVCHPVRTMARIVEDLLTNQCARHNLVADWICEGKASAVQWIRSRGVIRVHAIVAFGPGEIHVITESQVQSELRLDLPVVLDEPGILETFRRRRELDLIASTSEDAHHEASHAVATADGHVGVGTLRRTKVVEAEGAQGGVGAEKVLLMEASFESKLEAMLAANEVKKRA